MAKAKKPGLDQSVRQMFTGAQRIVNILSDFDEAGRETILGIVNRHEYKVRPPEDTRTGDLFAAPAAAPTVVPAPDTTALDGL